MFDTCEILTLIGNNSSRYSNEVNSRKDHEPNDKINFTSSRIKIERLVICKICSSICIYFITKLVTANKKVLVTGK